MDIIEIQKYLPHRYPFLLIDRVESVEKFGSVIALKNVTANEPQFSGHFPGNPIFPGVMILEAMAQAAGILGFVSCDQTAESGALYLFAGAESVRFKRRVVPGDVLRIEASYLTHKRNIWKFECRAWVGEQLAASATITSAEQKPSE
jgi:3-hydroxyacyl-[acyl-carrier-protein] dehydratase